MRPLRFDAFAAFAFVTALVWACSSKEATSPTPVLGDGGTTSDGGVSGGTAAVCAATREYKIRCAGESELDCGSSRFDAWCAEKDRKLNSEAFRKAETSCLPTASCDAKARQDCEYKSYAGQTQTAAQKALVEAYCATCEPSDTAGCAARAIAYDQAAGPESATDIFVAVWELSDAIVDEIRTKCTGSALADGSDPCSARFASCAAGPYLDGVPDCPP
jgi:hypothetical protein